MPPHLEVHTERSRNKSESRDSDAEESLSYNQSQLKQSESNLRKLVDVLATLAAFTELGLVGAALATATMGALSEFPVMWSIVVLWAFAGL